MSRGDDFWSRRKARVEAEEAGEARARAAAETAEREAALAEKTDAEILEELGLPDPDSLQPGDDVRGFMARAVPDRLRRRALRKLWLTNPALANLDGLLDYGEDFTDSALVIENLQTAYQVGRGMMGHVEELARQRAEEDVPDTAEAAEIVEEPVVDVETVRETVQSAPEPAPAAEPRPAEMATHEAEEAVPPRRRMNFTFGDHAGNGNTG